MESILIVDDEKAICKSLKGILEDEGYTVYTAYAPEDALSSVKKHMPAVVLLDVWFGQSAWDGLYCLDQLRHAYPLLPVIMMSGHATLNLAVNAMQKGALDFIEKPIPVERLLSGIKAALISVRPSAQPLLETWPLPLSRKLKRSDASEHHLIVVGKRGWGTFRMASTLQRLSLRKGASLIVVQSSFLNTLTPLQWFGQEQNGRVSTPGFLERYQGGTCIIQNIQDLNLTMQRNIAKIMDNTGHVRLGGQKSISFNVRFIATALPEFMNYKEESMSRTFHDRITGNPIEIKPLKDMDIPLWVHTLLHEIAHDWGMSSAPRVTQEVMQVLQAHPWPGHISQLHHMLELAMLNAPNSPLLELKDFPSGLVQPLMQVKETVSDLEPLFSMPLREARAVFELHYMQNHLARGNYTQAAQAMGMNRAAFHRKLKALKTKINI